MGYSMTQQLQKFNLPARHKDAARDALQVKMLVAARQGFGFCFTDMAVAIQAPTLEEALRACRYRCVVADNGDIQALHFEGEKLGSDKELLSYIASFVEPGSFLEFMGEDGDLWRWYFHDNTVSEVRPQIQWNMPISSEVVEMESSASLAARLPAGSI